MDMQFSTFNEKTERLIDVMAETDMHSRREYLGVELMTGTVRVPFFGTPYQVSSKGVVDADGGIVMPALASVLLTYCTFSPEKRSQACDWISYREFDGAGPLMGYFNENTGKTLERTFVGNIEKLKAAGAAMGGVETTAATSYDLIVEFNALPRIPVQIRFNDAEEGFPAACRLLFRKNAQNYLDLKSLGVIGTFLCGRLITSELPESQ